MNMTRMAALAIVLGGLAFGADAATVATNQDLAMPITNAALLLDPTSTSGTVHIDVAGSVLDPATRRSPYFGTAYHDTALYHSVSAGASATYSFADDQNGFSLMWGSPDSYNRLAFFLDGDEVFSLTGSDVANPPTPGLGFSNVTVSSLLFDEVRLSSTTNAFEFSNVTASPVPLPASLFMLLGGVFGLGGLGALRRRAAV